MVTMITRHETVIRRYDTTIPITDDTITMICGSVLDDYLEQYGARGAQDKYPEDLMTRENIVASIEGKENPLTHEKLSEGISIASLIYDWADDAFMEVYYDDSTSEMVEPDVKYEFEDVEE